MGAAAEVLEGPVAVQRDGLHPLVADQVLDQLHLVGLVLGAELLDRLAGRRASRRSNGSSALMCAAIASSIRSRSRRRPDALGELEVVVEAVLDRGADRDLGPRPELDHRLRHHVGRVVADQRQRVGIAVGDDLDRLSVVQRRREVAELSVRPARPAPPSRARGRSPRRRRHRSPHRAARSSEPSGSLTVTAPMLRSGSAALLLALPGGAHGDQRAGAGPADRASPAPEH